MNGSQEVVNEGNGNGLLRNLRKEPVKPRYDAFRAIDDLLKRQLNGFLWHRDILKRYMDGRLNIHLHWVGRNGNCFCSCVAAAVTPVIALAVT